MPGSAHANIKEKCTSNPLMQMPMIPISRYFFPSHATLYSCRSLLNARCKEKRDCEDVHIAQLVNNTFRPTRKAALLSQYPIHIFGRKPDNDFVRRIDPIYNISPSGHDGHATIRRIVCAPYELRVR
jgi:hypothetical protein